MTYTGKIEQDILNGENVKTGVGWQPIEPIELLR